MLSKLKIHFTLLVLLFSTLCYSQTIINAEKYFQPNDTAFFALSAEYAGNRGNSYVDQLDINVASGYRFARHTLRLMGGYSTLLENNQKILNGGYMQVRHNFDFSSMQIKTFAFYQLQFNDILLLTKRELVGLGLRGKLMNKGDDYFDFGSGLLYEIEQLNKDALSLNEQSLTKYFRISNLISCKVSFNDRISISNVFYYQPWIGLFSDYRVLDDFSVDFKVAENLVISITLVYRYDSDPPIALKQEDINIGTTLSLNF